MDLRRKPNGEWELRWRRAAASGRARSTARATRSGSKRTGFDASNSVTPLSRTTCRSASSSKPTGACTRCRTSRRRRASSTCCTWTNHIMPRLGDYGVRELTPKRLARFREELEKAGVGTATVRKAMAILQSILSFAVAEELVEFNAAASDPQAALRTGTGAPHLPARGGRGDPRQARPACATARSCHCSRTPGPGPKRSSAGLQWEDIGERAIRYRDTKRHRIRFTPLLAPLAEDLREWFLASGRPPADSRCSRPTTAASGARTTGATGAHESWRGERQRRTEPAQRADLSRCRAPGTRPRDLRSSFITVQVYAGVPLTTIAKQCGTSVTMIEQHYAGVHRELGRRADRGRASDQGRPPDSCPSDHRVSPIRDADARRRYHREWIARRRAEFFAGKTCVDCGTH